MIHEFTHIVGQDFVVVVDYFKCFHKNWITSCYEIMGLST